LQYLRKYCVISPILSNIVFIINIACLHANTHTQDFYLFDKLNAFVIQTYHFWWTLYLLVRTSGW